MRPCYRFLESDRRITIETSAPIVNDNVYPAVCGVGEEDFSAPLLLCAVGLAFTDPLSGENVSVATPGYAG